MTGPLSRGHSCRAIQEAASGAVGGGSETPPPCTPHPPSLSPKSLQTAEELSTCNFTYFLPLLLLSHFPATPPNSTCLFFLLSPSPSTQPLPSVCPTSVHLSLSLFPVQVSPSPSSSTSSPPSSSTSSPPSSSSAPSSPSSYPL